MIIIIWIKLSNLLFLILFFAIANGHNRNSNSRYHQKNKQSSSSNNYSSINEYIALDKVSITSMTNM